jgi:hypothetical protein
MDGETEGLLGGIGEVSPSGPLMPIAVLSSVPSQIARRRRAAPSLLGGGTWAALAAHKGGGPHRRLRGSIAVFSGPDLLGRASAAGTPKWGDFLLWEQGYFFHAGAPASAP